MREHSASSLRSDKEDVTLKDIAEAVGKSVAAVSRALNNHHDISEETRDYIKRVARQMGYSPTDTLGFILPTASPRDFDPYFSEILAGLTNEATKRGFDLLVSTCMPGPEERWAYLRLINGRRVDGMIITRPRWRDDRIELLLEKQFPFVVVGATNLQGDFLTISEDAAQGVKLMVEHLVTQGHKQIALINAPLNLFFASDFLAGFRQAISEAGLVLNEEFLETSDFTQKDGYQVTQKLLSKSETPTAIVTADDIVALGVMAAIRDQGLEVGSDIVVTGYGDVLLSEHSQPPLTTVHRPTYNLGQQACRMLTARLRGERLENTKLVFEPSLVIRQSSDLALWL
jgi:DNA-binding LacI/PurR family transcriptional regulator